MRRKKQTLWNLLNEFNPNEEISNAEYQVIDRLMSEFMTYKVGKKIILISDFLRLCKNFYNDINIIQNLLLKESDFKPIKKDKTIAEIETLKKQIDKIINSTQNTSIYVENLLNIIKLADFKERHKKVFYYIGIEQRSKKDLINLLSYQRRNLEYIISQINIKLLNLKDNKYIDNDIKAIIKATNKKNDEKGEDKGNFKLNLIKELSKGISQEYYTYFKTELGLEEIEKIKPKLLI